ncbi:MAG: DEAD/DEAH box helicase [Zetaproteobacteria bacterium]|nr:DEAD/DEAH box helicase [Zetaproteobacteria bacterium]
MLFKELGLNPRILRVLDEKGYTTPSPIQEKAIPEILSGRDVIACAETGTGKTASFSLPLLHRLAEQFDRRTRREPRVLILTPSRELAKQIGENIWNYSKNLPLRSAIIFGGMPMYRQRRDISKGVHIIIATPGRLLDHVRQGNIDLSTIQNLVLDEADRMLDMGFIKDIQKIIEALPAQRQNLLFSATYSREIKTLAQKILHDPAIVDLSNKTPASSRVNQVVHPVDRKRKRELLSHLIGDRNLEQVLVFTRTKVSADKLCEQLREDGLKSVAIHGDKNQGARLRALREFKEGSARVLVATDIVARGIDIHQLEHVINYELPTSPEDYVHRIGRTGRAGNKGNAYSLVSIDEHRLLVNIERVLKMKIDSVPVPSYEPDPSIKAPAAPRNGRSNGRGGRRYSSGNKGGSNYSRSSNGSQNFRSGSAPRHGRGPSSRSGSGRPGAGAGYRSRSGGAAAERRPRS